MAILIRPPFFAEVIQPEIFTTPESILMSMSERPPVAPFNQATATQKVRMAEDAWNTRDPEKVSMAYTVDSTWRNRSEFISGRDNIVQFLQRKWSTEGNYRLVKELWAYTHNRIAVRFAYEWQDEYDCWLRSYGNENWEFAENGLMQLRIASINDLPITELQRKLRWAGTRRPDNYPTLSELGL
jgi:nuclear transport factor 2 (NTF2) superfamily protein